MKRILALLLAIIAVIAFLGAAFMSGLYYLGYLSFYEFYTADTVRDSIIWAIVFAVVLSLFVLLLILSRKAEKNVVPTILLILSILAFSYLSLYFFVGNFFGYNGYSYTEDITNYKKHGANIDYFPDEISSDMKVVDYSFYYRYCDTYQLETYLEVCFENREVMDEYLSRAIFEFGENGVQIFENPYNPSYTDIVENCVAMSQWGGEEKYSAFIDFCQHSSINNYKYVEATYHAVSFSYDDLTIIFVSLEIGSDIEIGEYYSKYLRRFGIEWNPENRFYLPYDEPATEN